MIKRVLGGNTKLNATYYQKLAEAFRAVFNKQVDSDSLLAWEGMPVSAVLDAISGWQSTILKRVTNNGLPGEQWMIERPDASCPGSATQGQTVLNTG